MSNQIIIKSPILKKWWFWVIIFFVIIIIFSINNDGQKENNIDKTTEKNQQQAEKNAKEIYEQLIMDNANIIIDKIPKYASIESKICAYKDGFLIEDPYNAEWYIANNEIFAVNGLAKSLTPDINYTTAEISYQS